jgi:hypothetical protein
MNADAELTAMLRELAAMPRDKRAIVLESLGQAERDALCGLLSENDHAALSPELARLVDASRRGAPVDLTPRGREALIAAAAEGAEDEVIEQGLARTLAPKPRWSRFFSQTSARR